MSPLLGLCTYEHISVTSSGLPSERFADNTQCEHAMNFLFMAEQLIQYIFRFSTSFTNFAELTNDERSRTFLTVEIGAGHREASATAFTVLVITAQVLYM